MPRKYALSESESGSESDLSAPPSPPSDETLEKALRDAVAKIYKTGKIEELTVKRVRLAAEKSLQLEDGFYKGTGDWKARSDQVIKDEVKVQDTAAQDSRPAEDESKDRSSSPSDTTKLTKRAKPASSSTSRKRHKSTPDSNEIDERASDEGEDEITEPSTETQAKTVPKKKSRRESSEKIVSDDSDVNREGQKDEPGDGSESEMSVVLDEEPKPKPKRQRQRKTTGMTSRKEKQTATKGKKEADIDPNQAEIKRLQGWLIKCGIRKMWSRELAPYDTPKTKIQHLKSMLKDAGMDGRYSVDKAKQIREARELQADLELVQEGAKRWGKGSADDDGSDSGPRRRLNRGRRSLAFLESEGEETD
ncbi:hypothetical protein P175DRAFT_0504779 [Aspergillus ochraceoroseus IBT 24754]|uniref:Transcriptional regulator n=2 Tax=Aspergillus ochraceoroseus TaxID=138278 RepID=A0A2T5LMH5_9EURO|nr:uncharacterized protein P175DRAFT_0504779 [Aspergillus ochraceoroseus IBT 24754]KKK25013.1 hypothetical protein AOCH_000622 [Aspergillus ochraceoroseus]PTU17488.1 hypothetical protein P175DRAFT_0504779 [Aspergillus ochraceoroseus IBT 24754]